MTGPIPILFQKNFPVFEQRTLSKCLSQFTISKLYSNKLISTWETWAQQHWSQNPSTGCPKGQVMQGIWNRIKYLPTTRTDQSVLNNPHNRKHQDYAKLHQGLGNTEVQTRKYKCYRVSQIMHHLAKTI